MMNSIEIFVQFLRRDMRIFMRRIKNYAINYMILYPLMYGISFGYLMPLISFGYYNSAHTTLLFSGTMLLFLQVIVFVVNLDFLRDLESERYVDYQLSIVPGFSLSVILRQACLAWFLHAVLDRRCCDHRGPVQSP